MQWNELAVIPAVWKSYLLGTIGALPCFHSQQPNIGVTHNSSLYLPNTHTHRVMFELTLNSSFLKQTLSFHSFFSSEAVHLLRRLTDKWGWKVTKSRESGLRRYQEMQPFWHLSICALHHLWESSISVSSSTLSWKATSTLLLFAKHFKAILDNKFKFYCFTFPFFNIIIELLNHFYT